MKETGELIDVKEEDINKISVITGSAPAYLDYFIDALIKASVNQGMNEKDATEITSYGDANNAKFVAIGPDDEDAGVNIVYHEEYILKPDYEKPMTPHFVMDPNVVVFTLFPGIQEGIVRHILDAPELRSIVMRTYGSGNAPQKPWLMHLLKQATERGVNIVNISQCAAGTVEMARYDNGYQLKNAGVISGYDSTVESTVTKLMHLQGHYTDWRIIRKLMNHPMRGEFTQSL